MNQEQRRVLAAMRAGARASGNGMYLGRTTTGWAWAESQRSVLVLGPSRSGKTSSLIVPNVMAASGPVVSTSTKPDVMLQTLEARADCGRTYLYDPSGTVAAPPGVERVGWSPVQAAHAWDGALLTADAMARAARPAHSGEHLGGAEGHWVERSVTLLAPLLHAAALERRPMAEVLRWVDRHEGSPALDLLAHHLGESAVPTDALVGVLATDQREQSGIWSTASGILGAYRSPPALASTEGRLLEPSELCGGADTLYICAAGRQQQRLAPLVVGLIGEVRDAAYRASAYGQWSGGPPLLLALDEAANIAPIGDLPAMVSEGGGQGLVTLACLQDLSQARRRWGPEADAFLSLFGTTVVLGGIADVATLEALSTLAGEHEVPTRTVGLAQGADGRLAPSTSVATVRLRRLPVDVAARGAPGAAVVLDARNRLGWIGLTPAHAVEPWRALCGRTAERRSPAVAERPGAYPAGELTRAREPAPALRAR